MEPEENMIKKMIIRLQMNYDDSRGFETPFSFSSDTVSFAKPSQKG